MDQPTPAAMHDLGGSERFRCDAVERDDSPPDRFGRRVDALRQVLAAKGYMTVDELRRGIEAIPEAEYLRLSYYQKWIRSITDNLLRRGVITEAELRAALDRC